MRKIHEVQIGEKINHHKYGEGVITGKTKRTITATFVSGITVKNTYRYADAYFYASEF